MEAEENASLTKRIASSVCNCVLDLLRANDAIPQEKGKTLRPRNDIGLTMTSGIWLYEIAYHYSWGLDGLLSDLSRLSISLGGDVPFPIYFASFLVALPLVVRQYVGLNRPLLVIAASSAILFVVWLAIGFPQFWCVCSYEPVWGAWLPREIVEPLGYVMNSLTKLLAVVPAFLFCPDPKAH